uniref:Uncharacterized protein n=1 Tax=Nelumbo nucifera TaxID=4432 RepID=A0A822XZ73_NELNU|nr:TPA_asm: hypothetical protein HUJ06_027021 [Nelumbo nucifera]
MVMDSHVSAGFQKSIRDFQRERFVSHTRKAPLHTNLGGQIGNVDDIRTGYSCIAKGKEGRNFFLQKEWVQQFMARSTRRQDASGADDLTMEACRGGVRHHALKCRKSPLRAMPTFSLSAPLSICLKSEALSQKASHSSLFPLQGRMAHMEEGGDPL